jgi:hypothetical protein
MADKKILTSIDLKANTIKNIGAEGRHFDGTSGSVTFTPVTGTFIDTGESVTEVDNVDEALKWLFTYANDGKTNIAGVIGSPADSDKTFAQLAGYIQSAKNDLATLINRAEGTATVVSGNANQTLAELTEKLPEIRAFKTQTKLRRNSGQTYSITLDTPVLKSKLCVNVFQLVDDGLFDTFFATFNNGTSGNFIFDSTNVAIDSGTMRLKPTTGNMNYWDSEYAIIKSTTFDISSVSDFKITYIGGNAVFYDTMPLPQIVTASGSISTVDTSSLDKITLNASVSGNGSYRLAASTDGGVTYKAWKSSTSEWVTVYQPSNPSAQTFDVDGMTEAVAESLTNVEFDSLEGSNTSIQFAYWLSRPSFSDNIEIQDITLQGRTNGSFSPITGSLAANATITTTVVGNNVTELLITFNASDTFQINWIDT